jgi:hypothetical protein
MPMQQVEYEFPDPDKPEKEGVDIVLEDVEEAEPELEIEGAVGRETVGTGKDKSAVAEEDGMEIEVVDDTPVADRGRKASPPPEEVTDGELENYSEKVKRRIQHFSKGYHDERRAKEQALREREAAESYAQQVLEENKRLKDSGSKNQNALLESAKRQVEGELEAAKRAYKDAYEAGETDAIVEAQQQLNSAQIRIDKVNSFKPDRVAQETPLQPTANQVQPQVQAPQPQQVARDEKAESWRATNEWFGSDDEMTAFALGYHNKLVKEGIDPQTDTYYEKINTRMREVFPEQLDDGIEDGNEEPRQKSSNVVAPATRSTAPKKVRLNQTQISLAKKLGVPLTEYAKQVAELRRKT